MTSAIDSEGSLRVVRERYERRAWSEAVAGLSAADAIAALAPDDLERLAIASYLTGQDAAAHAAMARAHDGHVAAERHARGARCAFWLGTWCMERGERAHANGWFARGERALTALPHETAERGFLLVPDALRMAGSGHMDAVLEQFTEMATIGERCDDADLIALARQGQGRALLALGQVASGLEHLDEAMIAVTRDRVSPMIVGIVYCSVLDACREIGDVARAREWTDALAAWCAEQPDLVPYRGACMVHRAELRLMAGAWQAAQEESERACSWLAGPPPRPGAIGAQYQRGEIHRVLGQHELAAAAYRSVVELGGRAQPGSALLQLVEGRGQEAWRAIGTELADDPAPMARARLLPAATEIALAVGDVTSARALADELGALADALDAPFLRAAAHRAAGTVALAAGAAVEALVKLRMSVQGFAALEMPFEHARARALEGHAHRALGDAAAAEQAEAAARAIFERLGAHPAVTALAAPKAAGQPHPLRLTLREHQVLRLVATGASNKAIGRDLGISERTVERHVSHVFTKLGVGSRSAATDVAHRRRLL